MLSRRQWLKRSAMAAAAAPLLRPALPSSPVLAAPEEAIRLHANENPYGPSEKVRAVLRDNLDAARQYLDFEEDLGGLRADLAAREGLTPEHVVIGAGSGAILCMAAIAFGRDAGAIVAAEPTFNMLPYYAAQFGAPIRRVPLTDAFAHDLGAMSRRVTTETRLVYLCNPNNPTATLTDAAALRDFCTSTAARVPVFVDEAYHEYAEGMPGYASMVPLVAAGRNVIVSRTFSKLYGLAGLRIGYALARPDLAQRLRQWRMGIMNTLGVRAARTALADDAFRTYSRQQNNAVRTQLAATLDAHGLRHAPSHANFAYVHLGPNRRRFREKLAERGLLVTRLIDGEWVRISFGTPAQMNRLADALPEVL